MKPMTGIYIWSGQTFKSIWRGWGGHVHGWCSCICDQKERIMGPLTHLCHWLVKGNPWIKVANGPCAPYVCLINPLKQLLSIFSATIVTWQARDQTKKTPERSPWLNFCFKMHSWTLLQFMYSRSESEDCEFLLESSSRQLWIIKTTIMF